MKSVYFYLFPAFRGGTVNIRSRNSRPNRTPKNDTLSTYVPILVFLRLAVVDLGLMYVTGIKTDVRQHRPLIRSLGTYA